MSDARAVLLKQLETKLARQVAAVAATRLQIELVKKSR